MLSFFRANGLDVLDKDESGRQAKVEGDQLRALRELGICEVLPGSLYLGGAQDAKKLKKANPKGITHVLNVSDMYVLPPGESNGLICEWVPVNDDGNDNLFGPWQTEEQFEAVREADPEARPSGAYWRCKAFLEAAYKDPTSKVLVHCALGVNRSATIVVAWLLETRRWSVDYSLQYVHQCRPVISPAEKHKDQLLSFAKSLGIEEKHSCFIT